MIQVVRRLFDNLRLCCYLAVMSWPSVPMTRRGRERREREVRILIEDTKRRLGLTP